MGKIIVDAICSYKKIYKPKRCEECLLCDACIGWCSFYRKRIDIVIKPEFCKVIQITVEEE